MMTQPRIITSTSAVYAGQVSNLGANEQLVFVVGIGADGWDGLPRASQTAIATAQVIVGGRRQLELIPLIPGQERRLWPAPLLAGLPRLLDELRQRSVTVVASGDPLRSGIGSTLIDLLGADRVRVLPAISSVSLAGARMGWPAESYDVITVVGRNPAAILRSVSPGRRLIVLSSDESTPPLVADLLAGAGYGPSSLTVLCNLGSYQEARLDTVADRFPATTVPRLNVICVQCVPRATAVLLPTVGGLPDDAFEHDGQLTRRDARASALARLAPAPGQLLWDVGAGAGSVAIEWARTDPRCRAIAIERDPVRAERITINATRLGVPAITVVTGSAPLFLDGLQAPDAVFIGGGASNPSVLETCWRAMKLGARMVVHGVTLETEALLIEGHARLGGELMRMSIERVEPLGSFRGWTPARPIVQWSMVKTAHVGPTPGTGAKPSSAPPPGSGGEPGSAAPPSSEPPPTGPPDSAPAPTAGSTNTGSTNTGSNP